MLRTWTELEGREGHVLGEQTEAGERAAGCGPRLCPERNAGHWMWRETALKISRRELQKERNDSDPRLGVTGEKVEMGK